ncbi:hypothetical protein JQS43_08185 [Natronosporangium hydrolyticum]|uniref:ABC3 transporter permease C-terminal domain-containing protein n=1 Tax=Natronosporangium hydrolyticum TaxID=2811111 RepID=A0A895YL87_9ACTN|nr:FtsX-like permease family protein [Natronosporangium hydrolyticum]QSB16259.1 hypothetical protein JQS43_08185 [Natronosporangium hydrolyticum]
MSAHPPQQRGTTTRWWHDLALGLRLSVAGGRAGWARLALICAGVTLGVAMLFIAATIPAIAGAQNARVADRTEVWTSDLPPREDTLLIADARTAYGDRSIHGKLLQPDGLKAPLPPGLEQQPAPREMVVSPALADLLDTEEGALLRERWDAQVVGTIGPEGLEGPGEYAFYLGTDQLTEDALRIDTFGRSSSSSSLDPVMLLLSAVGVAVLLVPVVILVATAVRFGGEARDRQLAAIRLVGADTAMTRRVAAGETLAGALLGLVAGAALYVLIGLAAYRLVPPGLSFYLTDLRPVPALAVLVAVSVPVGAVLITLTTLRRVLVEPLGVVRLSGDRRRRLWWRLILPAAGLALLYPMHAGLADQPQGFEFRVAAGLAALLIGVALLLPWLVEATVRRLGGGGPAWQLAVRRLQLDSGTAVRAVSGIAVAVAGVIALQGLVAALDAEYTVETTRDTEHFQAEVRPFAADPQGEWAAALAADPAVRAVSTTTTTAAEPIGTVTGDAPYTDVTIGDCAALEAIAQVDECADGDVFLVDNPERQEPEPGGDYLLGSEHYGAEPEDKVEWTLPTSARTVPAHPGDMHGGTRILVTPAAIDTSSLPASPVDLLVALDSSPDALDQLRNAAAAVDPSASVSLIESRNLVGLFEGLRQGLLVGTVALLILIGASMLVNVAEQLRERRRLLAVLVAFGTRRRTLTGSILYQVGIPVLLGLSLAVLTGVGVAAILQLAAETPIRLDWPGIGATAGTAALVVLATTAASLPLLWRLTTPGGLRSE